MRGGSVRDGGTRGGLQGRQRWRGLQSRALCASCIVFLTVHRTKEPHVMAVEQKWETQIHQHVNHYHQCLQTSHLTQPEMMDHRP